MIDKEFVATMMSATAGVVKDFVSAAIAPLTDRIDELQKRLDAIRIPEAIKGDPGESIKGDKGDSGESAYEIAIKNGFEGSEKDWLESLRGEKGEDSKLAGPPGPKGDKGDSIKGDPGESIKGDPGPMGLSAYQLAQNEGFRGTRAEWLESLKGPKGDSGDSIKGEKGDSIKGEPGMSAYQIACEYGFIGTELQWIVSLKGTDGNPGQNGKNADPIHPDTIALMVTREVQAAIAALPKPKNGDPGEPGRDALHIDILPEIDSKKSYARGTYAQHDGGLLKAKRRTTSADAINLNEWEVIIRGISRIEFKQDETDPRQFVIRSVMTGEIAEEAKFRIPVIIHKGAFVRETIYEKGDVVRWDRSSYVCQADKTSEVPMPLSKDWAILAQRGDRGNDGKNVELPKPHTPVRIGDNGSEK